MNPVVWKEQEHIGHSRQTLIPGNSNSLAAAFSRFHHFAIHHFANSCAQKDGGQNDVGQNDKDVAGRRNVAEHVFSSGQKSLYARE